MQIINITKKEIEKIEEKNKQDFREFIFKKFNINYYPIKYLTHNNTNKSFDLIGEDYVICGYFGEEKYFSISEIINISEYKSKKVRFEDWTDIDKINEVKNKIEKIKDWILKIDDFAVYIGLPSDKIKELFEKEFFYELDKKAQYLKYECKSLEETKIKLQNSILSLKNEERKKQSLLKENQDLIKKILKQQKIDDLKKQLQDLENIE